MNRRRVQGLLLPQSPSFSLWNVKLRYRQTQRRFSRYFYVIFFSFRGKNERKREKNSLASFRFRKWKKGERSQSWFHSPDTTHTVKVPEINDFSTFCRMEKFPRKIGIFSRDVILSTNPWNAENDNCFTTKCLHRMPNLTNIYPHVTNINVKKSEDFIYLSGLVNFLI